MGINIRPHAVCTQFEIDVFFVDMKNHIDKKSLITQSAN